MALFGKKRTAAARESVDRARLPQHVAVILDGNGRWARRRGLPRSAGHAAGAENFRTIATLCKNMGIKYFTVYAFSTENWKRPTEEVAAIMKLLGQYLQESIEKMEKDHIRLHFWGDLTPLSDELKALCATTDRISEGYTGMDVNVCLNYGGRDEIMHAARAFAQECLDAGRVPEKMEPSMLERHLYSAGVPDPDLIIRPSGEERISNFLLWQSAYAEYYFTDVMWPDFNEDELLRAFAAYQKRTRRFGGIDETEKDG
ncbi:MAG: di-trans,poly-cis-decaprenylcistransferase [Oscillospiraceae bacterium]|nr:di-trans,poly-cis-decaprenylcistransferase [Oscillospiraceae bacterium]